MLFGGREAEALLVGELSIGSADDLDRATEIARSLVEDYGMGSGVGARRLSPHRHTHEPAALADATRATADDNIRDVLERERLRAHRILAENLQVVTSLRDLLLEKKVLDSEALGHLIGDQRG
jgi:cell division protease FtsH